MAYHVSGQESNREGINEMGLRNRINTQCNTPARAEADVVSGLDELDE